MLAREFMRLTALEALRPSAMLDEPNAAWPTLAGDYVFDSRIGPFDDLGDDEKRPVCAVYTEDTTLQKIAQSGSQLYASAVDLVFEISVVAKFQYEDGAGLIVDYADTDAAVEAMLGSLEDQIFHALHLGDSGKLFRQMVKLPFLEWHSTIKRSGEESVRYAARSIRTKIMLKETCYDAVPRAVAEGLNRLPAGLRPIAQALAPSTYLRALAEGMAAVAPQMPVRPLLQSIGIDLARVDPDTTLAAGVANNLQG